MFLVHNINSKNITKNNLRNGGLNKFQTFDIIFDGMMKSIIYEMGNERINEIIRIL